MNFKLRQQLLTLAVCSIFFGCGQNGDLIVPVSGIVTMDGMPVEGASVMLIPEAGRPATGRTNAQGEFRMTTLSNYDGAIVGRHRVTVSLVKLPAKPMDYELADSPQSLTLLEHMVPQRYTDPDTSGLTVDVVRGMEPISLNLD